MRGNRNLVPGAIERRRNGHGPSTEAETRFYSFNVEVCVDMRKFREMYPGRGLSEGVQALVLGELTTLVDSLAYVRSRSVRRGGY